MRQHTAPREIHGIAALFLSFDEHGRFDRDALSASVARARDAGLDVAVNMDTGFGSALTPTERREVLHVTRQVLGPRVAFVAGAMPFGHDTDRLDAYRDEVYAICEVGATPIIFPSEELPADVVPFIEEVVTDAPRALAFELGPQFAPFGRMFDADTFKALLQVPGLVGLKHSSLSRTLEWERLDLAAAERPGFRIYTGNDLAIDMVCFGSDYLLGLAAFDVDAFASRDRCWADGDDRFWALNDALQAVGRVAFREPVPAYKDSCAVYLRVTGQLPDARPHPSCERRPDWESSLLEPLAATLAAAKEDR